MRLFIFLLCKIYLSILIGQNRIGKQKYQLNNDNTKLLYQDLVKNIDDENTPVGLENIYLKSKYYQKRENSKDGSTNLKLLENSKNETERDRLIIPLSHKQCEPEIALNDSENQKFISAYTLNNSQLYFLIAFFFILFILLFSLSIKVLFKNELLFIENKRVQKKSKKITENIARSITHTLITPVKLISLAVENLFLDRSLKEYSNINLSLISSCSDQLQQVNKEFLELKKNKLHPPRLMMYKFQVKDLLCHIKDKLSMLGSDRNPNLRVLNESVTEVCIESDPAKLYYVIDSIIQFSIKFNQGSNDITIIYRNVKEELKISIIDKGIGISKDVLPYIFDRYYQGNTTAQYKKDGTGLAICKEYVTLLGGTISVVSKIGSGSEFRINIPIKLDCDTHVTIEPYSFLQLPTKTILSEGLSNSKRYDMLFLNNLEIKISENLSDPNFNLHYLAKELGISKRQLHRKVKELKGQTPKSYVNDLRFKEAKIKLEKKSFSTVKEIAFSVGFKAEKNFSKNFKTRFGKYPKDILYS